MVSMAEGHNSNPAFSPIVQVISVKAIQASASDRFRVCVNYIYIYIYAVVGVGLYIYFNGFQSLVSHSLFLFFLSLFHPLLLLIHSCMHSCYSISIHTFIQTILSDGDHYVNGMLATQLNHLVQSNQLRSHCLIQVEEFMNNLVQGKTVIILLKLRIVAHLDVRMGNPVDVEMMHSISNVGSGSGGVGLGGTAQPMYNRTNHVVGDGSANSYHNANSMPTTASSSSYNKTTSSNNPYGRYGSGQATNSPVKSHGMMGTTTATTAPIVRAGTSSTTVHCTPIANLNMYQNRWTIRARVTTKSDIRTWSNAKGEGSLFSIELLDSSHMDIRATFFKEAVDKFYTLLQIGKVYTLSGGRLKVASQQYNTCKSQYEITFDQNSEIHLDNDVGDIQEQVYDFIKIANLEQFDANKFVDILAIVKYVGEPTSLMSKKSGQELTKCDLTLVDDSDVEVTLTVWGDKAQRAPIDYAHCPVVAFRRARVSDYGGKSLSASDGPIIVLPDVPQAFQLQEWWKASGSLQGSTTIKSLSTSAGGAGKMDSLTERKDIASIKRDNLGYGSPDKPDWISFKGTITFLKKDKEGGAWYTACPNDKEPCQNRYKVNQTTDGQWHCEKCHSTYATCVRRWIFSGTVADDTSNTWVSLFNDQAEVLLKATADEVFATTSSAADGGGGDQDKYDSYFSQATNTEWIFKCKVKNEMVGDESRVKTSVYSMLPVDHVKESRDLLAALAKF